MLLSLLFGARLLLPCDALAATWPVVTEPARDSTFS